jgi:hypothetical protein
LTRYEQLLTFIQGTLVGGRHGNRNAAQQTQTHHGGTQMELIVLSP